MQNVSSTYQTNEHNLAVSGSSKNIAINSQSAYDFAALFASLSQNDTQGSLKSIISSNYQNQKDNVQSFKLNSKVDGKNTDKPQELEENEKTDKDEMSDKDEKVDKVNAKEQKRENQALDESICITNVSTLPDSYELNNLTEQTKLNFDSSLNLEPIVPAKNDQAVNTTLSVPKDTSIDLLNSKNTSAEDFLQKLSEFLKNNLEDETALNDFIKNLDLDSLESLETLKEGLKDNLKQNLSASLNPNSTLGATTTVNTNSAIGANATLNQNVSSDNLAKLQSEFESLNVTNLKVNPQSSIAQGEDFGALDFDLIEQSLKISMELDERVQSADTKAKIDNLMDSKEEALNNTLAQSLALLKQSSTSINQVSGESVSVTKNLEQKLENTLAKTSSSLFSQEAALNQASLKTNTQTSQEQGQSSLMQNFEKSNMMQAAKSAKQEASSFNQEMDLLTLSKNLKENAQALTEKVMQMASRNLKQVTLDLNPENLGKMKISVDLNAKDDVANISISASSATTKALIEGSLDLLKDNLKNNDIEANAQLVDYNEESDKQNESEQEPHHQQNEKQNEHVLFASSDEELEDSQVDDLENLNNSQNSNGISYFA